MLATLSVPFTSLRPGAVTRRRPGSFPLVRAAILGLAVAVGIARPAQAQAPDADTVSIGSAVTEIVFALDQEHRLLARDSTSTFPPAAAELPDVGYMRALSAEGVLSVAPSMILASEGTGPPEVVEVLKRTGLAYVEVPEGYTAAAIATKIKIIGDALGVPDRAAKLAATVRQDIATAQTNSDAIGTPKRVMFLMSAQGGKLIAAGRKTAADAVIELAGGRNAVTGFDGYKTLEDEAAAAAAPDVVLMMDRAGDHSATYADLFALPSLATTPAALSGALIRMDGARILGFGPRTGAAIRDLNAALYGG